LVIEQDSAQSIHDDAGMVTGMFEFVQRGPHRTDRCARGGSVAQPRQRVRRKLAIFLCA
jgi:hypothetical protein